MVIAMAASLKAGIVSTQIETVSVNVTVIVAGMNGIVVNATGTESARGNASAITTNATPVAPSVTGSETLENIATSAPIVTNQTWTGATTTIVNLLETLKE
jgi:hypothetical protein